MRVEILPLGFNKLSYDNFTWSDNDKANSKEKILVAIPISDFQLKQLSSSTYLNYLNVLNDVPDYFNNWDEPFPNNELDIYNNPEKLIYYFLKSSLWSDFLIKKISELQKWNFEFSNFHVLNVNEVKILDKTLYIFMLSVKVC